MPITVVLLTGKWDGNSLFSFSHAQNLRTVEEMHTVRRSCVCGHKQMCAYMYEEADDKNIYNLECVVELNLVTI